MQVFDRPLFHQLFCNFSRHCKRFEQRKEKTHLLSVGLMVLTHKTFSYDFEHVSFFRLVDQGRHLSDEGVFKSQIL